MIKGLTVGDVIPENTYLYIDDKTKQGFIIDPGAQAEQLAEYIQQNGFGIQAILLTHGHVDHIGAVDCLHKTLNVPYYISEPGEAYLADPNLNLSAQFGQPVSLKDAVYYKDGDFISVPDNPEFGLKVIATPGHTPDSVILYSEADKAAFVGDTIFQGTWGATHFPGGNAKTIYESIVNKVLSLPDDTALYSGHTPPTTVGIEKPNYVR